MKNDPYNSKLLGIVTMPIKNNLLFHFMYDDLFRKALYYNKLTSTIAAHLGKEDSECAVEKKLLLRQCQNGIGKYLAFIDISG